MAREIPLTQGKVAIVDDADYEWIGCWRWQYHRDKNGNGYAVRSDKSTGKKVHLLMHRVIAGAQGTALVDHVDGDGLNNRRLNLRICDATGNARNTSRRRGSISQYKGVTWNKPNSLWRAYITVDRRMHYLGSYADEAFAARIHDRYARELHGKFARLNFPDLPSPTDAEVAVQRINRIRDAKLSVYRGVTFYRESSRWQAQIQVSGRRIHLGRFDSQEAAARQYNEAARKYHGAKAILNQLEETA